MIQEQTLALRYRPSEAAYAYGVSQYEVQPSRFWTSHW
jgi:hypothetical protein